MMTQEITLTINKREYTLTVDVRSSLLDLLRELGFTSVKQGCGVGECGACTVLVDDVAVDSCLYLALWAQGKTIRTVEGECANGKLSKVQEAYVEEGAVQCGFCTPGLIMATTGFLEKHRDSGKEFTREELKKAHAGNLCRCTGYQTIINAVERAGKK
jgi:aerobic-type carbon monoxide dehydrogenase small subunit (CoxS/CutS family)